MYWIRGREEARSRGSEFDFLICDSTGSILGVCGLNQINDVHHFANLGYWVRSASTGRGVAVEAVRLLRRWTFENTDLERLEIVVARGNWRSERVAEKAGAVREGALRSRLNVRGVYFDATMFSIVREPEPTR